MADIIFNGDVDVTMDVQESSPQAGRKLRSFMKPLESLAQTLDNSKGPNKPLKKRPNYSNRKSDPTVDEENPTTSEDVDEGKEENSELDEEKTETKERV
jgi:hypothetical protein